LKRTDVVVQLLLVFFFVLAWFVLTQSQTTTGIFWLYVYAPIAALLLKRKIALFWVFAYAAWIAVIANASWLGPIGYSVSQVYAFIASFLPISLFMIAYQRITESAEREVYEKDIELKALTKKLQYELIFASHSKKQLDGLSVALARQNKKLTRGQAALVNLLEDAKELENELVLAKQHVEEKVEQRTQELSIERSRLESTLQSLPVAVLLLNEKMKVVDANNQAYELVGEEPTGDGAGLPTAVSRKLYKFMSNELVLADHIQQCVATQACVMLGEVSYKEAYYKVALGPVQSVGNDPSGGVVVVVENITAQKMLERSKDEFLMIASHELRTPLTAIRGNAVILEKMFAKKAQSPEFDELTTDIQDSSTRLLSIVNDYLELSSMEQGRRVFNQDVVDLAALAHTIISENQGLAREKKLDLKVKGSRAKKILVRADARRVQQVIENLIANAIHYTNRGSVTLEFAQAGDLVTCRIRDTGIGIAKSSQQNIFTKFHQAQENLLTRDPERSTGLGLYITKLMVEGMGGKIILEHSALRKGSVFAFSLPSAKSVRSVGQNAQKNATMKSKGD
jgi:signal transduction histidine kinase